MLTVLADLTDESHRGCFKILIITNKNVGKEKSPLSFWDKNQQVSRPSLPGKYQTFEVAKTIMV